MSGYMKENRGAIFFNVALAALVIISLLTSRFPSFSILFVLGAAILAVLAPLIAARLELTDASAACEVSSGSPASAYAEDHLAGVASEQPTVASDQPTSVSSSGLFQATRDALRGQVHADAYSRLIEDLARQVGPSVEVEVGATKENFAVTLNIINVYISGTTMRSGAEIGGKKDFILQPELISELYGKHGAVH